MSLGQRLRLDLEDGRQIESSYNGIDLRAWESKHRKSALTEEMSVSMLTWLGHHAAVRTGALNGDLSTYEAFDKVCVSVEGQRDEAPPDPPKATRPKASQKRPGAAPSSPS